jgi:hypothetical protein
MNTPNMSPEEAEEYRRLYAKYAAASQYAGAVLRTHGMESEAFRQAYGAVGKLWTRLRDLQGLGGMSWMA